MHPAGSHSVLLSELVHDAVGRLLGSDDFASFLAWMQEEVPGRLPEGMLPSSPADSRPFATSLALSLWSSTPHPAAGFRPRPAPKLGRNDPCPCGSGRKYKRCCGNQSQLPGFPPELLWIPVALHLPIAQLRRASESGALSPAPAGGAAHVLLEQVQPKRALALVEPFFLRSAGQLARYDSRYEVALDALFDAYNALGFTHKKSETFERLARELRPPLRAALFLRWAAAAADAGEGPRSWELFERARQDDPDHPALGSLEITLLAAEGEGARAVERARFWEARLERQGYGEDDEPRRFLASFARDPGAELITGQLPEDVDREQVERFLALVRSARDRPVRPYGLEARDPAAGVLLTPRALSKVEAAWRAAAPCPLPEDIGDDTEEGSFESAGALAWDPDAAASWLAVLERRSEAFDSLLVLQDLVVVANHLETGADRWRDLELVLPLAERGATILEASLAGQPAGLCLSRSEGEPHATNQAGLNLLLTQLLTAHRVDQELDPARLERLLALDPADELGARILGMRRLLITGDDTGALAFAVRFPGDLNLELVYGRVLALSRLERSAEAEAALIESIVSDRSLLLVADYLTGHRKKRPASGAFWVSWEERCFNYARSVLPLWQAAPAAIATLRQARRRAVAYAREAERRAQREAEARRSLRNSETAGQICKIRVELLDIEPPIWRRFEMPYTATFWDLHVAIQDVMGWRDSHLHAFEVEHPESGEQVRIGLAEPDAPWPGPQSLLDWNVGLAEYLDPEHPAVGYLYDFGDNWEHAIRLEAIVPAEQGKLYPRCTGGARAAPPENCGGVAGYRDLVAAMKDRRHPGREDYLEWLGGPYDPEAFDHRGVRFWDPGARLRSVTGAPRRHSRPAGKPRSPSAETQLTLLPDPPAPRTA